MKKTVFCNSEFYLSWTKNIPDKSGTADGTHTYQEELNSLWTIQNVSRFKNYYSSNHYHYSVLRCQRVFRAYVFACHRALCTYVFTCLRANVPCMFTCSCGNVSCVFSCLRANIPYVLIFRRALRAYVLTCYNFK